MNTLKEVYSQLKKDTPIEPWMGTLTSVLFARISDAIRYRSTATRGPFTLGFNHMVRFMRNAQDLFVNVVESTDNHGRIDMSRFSGGISTITNSNPASTILALRRADLSTTVGPDKIPARSCGLDVTGGDKELIPLAVAAFKGECSDADYWATYQPTPESQFSFYYQPVTAFPMHCLFTHPAQLRVEQYVQLGEQAKGALRSEHVDPYWSRIMRLNEKVAQFCIEV